MTVTREMVLTVADHAFRKGFFTLFDMLHNYADAVWPPDPTQPPSYSHWGMFPE